jgi:hypothetical protein
VLGDLKDLRNHDGWRYLVATWKEVQDKIKDTVMATQTDQSPRWNSDHLLKERYSVLDLVIRSVDSDIKTLELKYEAMSQHEKPVAQRLDELNQKWSEDIKEKM